MWSLKTPTPCWISLVRFFILGLMTVVIKHAEAHCVITDFTKTWACCSCAHRWKQQPELSVRRLSAKTWQQQQHVELTACQPTAYLQSAGGGLSATHARTGKRRRYAGFSLNQRALIFGQNTCHFNYVYVSVVHNTEPVHSGREGADEPPTLIKEDLLTSGTARRRTSDTQVSYM